MNSPAQRRWKEKLKFRRRNGIDVAYFILQDSRGIDRKKGLRNDLTLELIEKKIKRGCSYCGEAKLRMTLDRIDNAKGHSKENVRAACIRCNYARGNMPYAAWLCLVEGMRQARLKGLFGTWIGRLNRPKSGEPDHGA